MKRKLNLPRVPLPRQTGGAHRVKRELSAREELTLRLNEMEAEGRDTTDFQQIVEDIDEEDADYYDYLLSKLEAVGGSR